MWLCDQAPKSIAPRALPLGSTHARGGPHRGGCGGCPSGCSKGPRRRRLPQGGPSPGLPPAQRARTRLLDRPSGSVEPALPPALRPQAPRPGRPPGALKGPLELDHEARMLFKKDLWNRFDALHALAAKDSRAMPLARLLARLRARVALTKDELAGMRLSSAEAAQERLDLLDPRLFEADSGWSELVSYFDVGPGSELGGGTTMHARRAAWRLVFRRFVRVPPE